MKHFLLFHEGAPDHLERRPQFRSDHLAYAWAEADRGELRAGRAYPEPADGAVLMSAGENRSVAERFAGGDPCIANGLIRRWHVREWTAVIGEYALRPAYPEEA